MRTSVSRLRLVDPAAEFSLVDAGAKARSKGRQAFAEVETLGDAAQATNRQLHICRNWGTVLAATFLFYNEVAFAPRKVVRQLAESLRVEPFAEGEMNDVLSAVFDDAFTQRNKAVKDRYKTDLSTDEQEKLVASMPLARSFISRVMDRKDFTWFDKAAEV